MSGSRGWLVYGSRPRYAEELLEIIGRRDEQIVAVVDNLQESVDQVLNGVRLVGRDDAGALLVDADVVVGAGPGGIRQILQDEARALGASSFPALMDPTAVCARSAELDEGATVNALVVIGAHTRVGRFVQINRSASIGHDVMLADFCTLGPNVTLTSSVQVGVGAFIGAGAVILPGTVIGANATVGAGAVVTRDVAPHAVVVGNPARPIGKQVGHDGYAVTP